MSRVLPDPQIQSLKAMRAGDIAFARGQVTPITVGVVPAATPLPTANLSIPTPVATPSLGAAPDMPSEIGGPVAVVPTTLTTQDALQSVTVPATTDTLVTIDGPFDPGTMTVTVGKATSVV